MYIKYFNSFFKRYLKYYNKDNIEASLNEINIFIIKSNSWKKINYLN